MPRKAKRHDEKTAKLKAVSQREKTAERGYGYAWQQFSKKFRRQNPLCAECERLGRATKAEHVDHIRPHKGDPELFWRGPFQSLCRSCHSRKTAFEREAATI